MIGKEEKAEKKDAYHDTKQGGVRICPVGQCKPVREQKRGQGAQNKYADIQNKKVPAQQACIGIEKNRDECGSGQNSETEGRNDTGIIFFQAADHEKGV